MIAAGADVDVVCSDLHPIHSIRGLTKSYRYGRVWPLASLARAIDRSDPQLIIASDDIAVGHLQALVRTGRPELAALIERSLGPAESYEIIASRTRFSRTARLAGVDTPDCAEVASVAELTAWLGEFGAPAFLKLDETCGGEGVRLIREGDDLSGAITTLRQAAALPSAPDRVRKNGPKVSVHKAVAGQPANCSALAWRGEVLSVLSVVTLQTLRPFGIATVVRPVDNPAMRDAAAAIARELNLTGFFGLDFILQDGGRRAWVLELNPRPTPISHFALGEGRDLVAALVSKLEARERADRPAAFPPEANVAIFPHMLRGGGGEAPQLDDWPVGQPRLVRAFERRRRFADYRALLGDWFRPRKPADLLVQLTGSPGVSGN